jgi:hypothetical protein
MWHAYNEIAFEFQQTLFEKGDGISKSFQLKRWIRTHQKLEA